MTTIINGSSPSITFSDSTTQTTAFTTTPVINSINSASSTPLIFGINGTESARFDTNGNLTVGTNGTTYGDKIVFQQTVVTGFTQRNIGINNSGVYRYIAFVAGAGGTQTGYIQSGDGTSTTYSTSSDYRLKENVAPMTGALDTVAKLKPVTYTWKQTGKNSQGFIAHELQEIIPEAVVGEKDAVNEDGSINAQGIDTSFIVATLTAAIQELNAKVELLQKPTPTADQIAAKASALAKLTALGLTQAEVTALIG